jgi:hypothetical protein
MANLIPLSQPRKVTTPQPERAHIAAVLDGSPIAGMAI